MISSSGTAFSVGRGNKPGRSQCGLNGSANVSFSPALAARLRRIWRTGDLLMVTLLDRLARSTRSLLNTLAAITSRKLCSLADAWADKCVMESTVAAALTA